MNEEYGFDITFFEAHLNCRTAPLSENYDAVCVFVNDVIDEMVIEDLVKHGVKIIGLRCAGYNNVNLPAAAGRVQVARVPAYSPHAVAEHTLALMLSLNRKLHRAYHRTREGNFSINGLLGFDMNKRTAGVIGLGKIGIVVTSVLEGIGMHVCAYDPFASDAVKEQYGDKLVGLDELYKQSDVITLHCPLSEDNEYMINKKSIAKMRDGVMLINTGRGKLIDTRALIDGLKSGKIGSAGLDVYEEESDYFFEDLSEEMISDDTLARLLTFPNVLVTSHQAFFTAEALENIAHTTLQNFADCFAGKKLTNEVAAQ